MKVVGLAALDPPYHVNPPAHIGQYYLLSRVEMELSSLAGQSRGCWGLRPDAIEKTR